MKLFHAYLVTCATTGKRYVGITSRDVSRRWIEHIHRAKSHPERSAFLAAIAKYGRESFAIEVVCCAKSWADICAIEAALVSRFNTLSPNGYNLTLGGDGRFGYHPSKEAVERSAAKHRGKPCHPNTRMAARRTHLGIPKSDIHRAKIATTKKGQPRSQATKEKLVAYWAERRARGEFQTTRPYEHHAK